MGCIRQGLLFWLFKGVFKISSATVEWCSSTDGTHFDNSEVSSLVG